MGILWGYVSGFRMILDLLKIFSFNMSMNPFILGIGCFFSVKQIQRLILADDWQLHRLRQIIKRGRRIPDGAFQQATIAGGFYLVHWGSYILLNYAVILCIALCLHYG